MADQCQKTTIDPRIIFATRFLAKKCLSPGDAIQETVTVLNLSSSRFRHLFKKETGLSPAHYVKHLRLQHARKLLEKSALSVKEVMASAGINDFSHFVRDFKTTYGLTPSQLRRLSLTATVPELMDQQYRPTDSQHGQHEMIAFLGTDDKLLTKPS